MEGPRLGVRDEDQLPGAGSGAGGKQAEDRRTGSETGERWLIDSLHLRTSVDYIGWIQASPGLRDPLLSSTSFHKVHREEGLELHLEMISKQRGQARDGTKSAAMQEELAALCTKLSAANARVVIMENTKAKLEQELASEK